MEGSSVTTGFMSSSYDNPQAAKAVAAWWLSYKDGMKPVIADKHACY